MQHYMFTTGSLDGSGASGPWRCFFSLNLIVPSVIKVNYFSVIEFSVEPSISLTKCYRISYFFFMADRYIYSLMILVYLPVVQPSPVSTFSTFSSFEKEVMKALSSHSKFPLFPSPPQQPVIYCLSLFWTFHVSGIIQHMALASFN